MNQSDIEVTQHEPYAVGQLGCLSQLHNHRFAHPALSFEVEGKVFLRDVLQLTSAEISVNKMAPGAGMPFYHKHQRNEEIYLFIQGKGQIQLDGKVFDVREGTVVRVSPESERCWRNTSNEPLIYIVVQAKAESYQQGSTIEDGVGIDKKVQW